MLVVTLQMHMTVPGFCVKTITIQLHSTKSCVTMVGINNQLRNSVLLVFMTSVHILHSGSAFRKLLF